MKHIKLFEQLSSVLPKVFTVEEIKNMTEEEFFKVMEMYYREHNSDQAFTLMQVWTKAHPEKSKDAYFYSKLGKYADFIENAGFETPGRSQQIEDFDKMRGEEKKSENFKNDWEDFLARMEKRVSDRERETLAQRADLEKLKSGGKDALNRVSPEMKNQAIQWFRGHIDF